MSIAVNTFLFEPHFKKHTYYSNLLWKIFTALPLFHILSCYRINPKRIELTFPPSKFYTQNLNMTTLKKVVLI